MEPESGCREWSAALGVPADAAVERAAVERAAVEQRTGAGVRTEGGSPRSRGEAGSLGLRGSLGPAGTREGSHPVGFGDRVQGYRDKPGAGRYRRRCTGCSWGRWPYRISGNESSSRHQLGLGAPGVVGCHAGTATVEVRPELNSTLRVWSSFDSLQCVIRAALNSARPGLSVLRAPSAAGTD